jgi:threonine/homoserine/homoserine lactone efflux protein
MAFDAWLELAVVCSLGAISPGPSFAVVLRNTVVGGKRRGVMCGLGHGIGFTIYAGIAITGLGILIQADHTAFSLLQFAGLFFLGFVATQMLMASRIPGPVTAHEGGGRRGFGEGFLIAFLNPKILVFLTAVFSQFISTDLSITEQVGMALLAGFIDGGWYIFVATMLAGTPLIEKLQQRRHHIDAVIGVVLMLTAIVLLASLLM